MPRQSFVRRGSQGGLAGLGQLQPGARTCASFPAWRSIGQAKAQDRARFVFHLPWLLALVGLRILVMVEVTAIQHRRDLLQRRRRGPAVLVSDRHFPRVDQPEHRQQVMQARPLHVSTDQGHRLSDAIVFLLLLETPAAAAEGPGGGLLAIERASPAEFSGGSDGQGRQSPS